MSLLSPLPNQGRCQENWYTCFLLGQMGSEGDSCEHYVMSRQRDMIVLTVPTR